MSELVGTSNTSGTNGDSPMVMEHLKRMERLLQAGINRQRELKASIVAQHAEMKDLMDAQLAEIKFSMK